MLSRQKSLNNPKVISYLFKKGFFLNSRIFNIKYSKSLDGAFKLLIIISKKKAKKAVSRNLLRRRIKHIIHKSKIDEFPINLIISPKRNIETLSFQDMEKDIEKSFQNLKTF